MTVSSSMGPLSSFTIVLSQSYDSRYVFTLADRAVSLIRKGGV